MSKLRWFRLYDNVITSPKVQLLPLEVRWKWIETLCIASQNTERGCLPPLEHVAFHLKLSIEDADTILKILIDAGLIDKVQGSKKLQMHNWDERQFSSDNSYERVKRFRERKRNVSSAVTETLQKRNSTQARGTDTDTETETESSSPYPLLHETPPNSSPRPCAEIATETMTETMIAKEKPSDEETVEPPEYPDELNSLFIIHPGDHKHTELEARRIWGVIWRTWKNAKLCIQFYEHQQWISISGWEYAIKTVIKKGITPGCIQYLEKIGITADLNGIKPDNPIQRGKIGSVPYVPTAEQNGNGTTTNMPYSAINPPPDLAKYDTQECRDAIAKIQAQREAKEKEQRERAAKRR